MIHSRHFDTTTVTYSSAALRVTPTELTHLLDISPDALLIVNGEGIIVVANEQAAELFGYRREELHELQLEMLLPQRSTCSACRHLEGVFQHSAHTRDGRRTPPVGATQGWNGIPGGYQFASRAAW